MGEGSVGGDSSPQVRGSGHALLSCQCSDLRRLSGSEHARQLHLKSIEARERERLQDNYVALRRETERQMEEQLAQSLRDQQAATDLHNRLMEEVREATRSNMTVRAGDTLSISVTIDGQPIEVPPLPPVPDVGALFQLVNSSGRVEWTEVTNTMEQMNEDMAQMYRDAAEALRHRAPATPPVPKRSKPVKKEQAPHNRRGPRLIED